MKFDNRKQQLKNILNTQARTTSNKPHTMQIKCIPPIPGNLLTQENRNCK